MRIVTIRGVRELPSTMTPSVDRVSPIVHRAPPYRLSPGVMHRSPERTTTYKAGRARRNSP